MSKLKELTWENHKKAERKQFAKLLMSGEIKPLLYATFLYNQFHCYKALEENITLPRDLDPIYRAQKILDDCWEIVVKSRLLGYKIPILETTKDYVNHVKNLDQHGLMSHLYVRHFGDMYGGSMIAKKVPGEGRMYQFKNKEHLISRVRSKLNDNMAPEANVCFEYATKMFEEIVNYDFRQDNRMRTKNHRKVRQFRRRTV